MSQVARRAKGTLEMDLEARAPAGALTDADGRRLEFSGWTELAAVIQDWRTRPEALTGGSRERPAPAQPARSAPVEGLGRTKDAQTHASSGTKGSEPNAQQPRAARQANVAALLPLDGRAATTPIHDRHQRRPTTQPGEPPGGRP
jgi:hypothetical protein